VPHNPKLAESHGLGSIGEVPLGGDSARAQPSVLPQRNSRVAEILAEDPKFIKVGFHIGWFITTAVDTEAERANTEVL
jgi:hypothetical protein